MKNASLLLFLALLLFSCNKDPRLPLPEEVPFLYEDDYIKIIELEESTMPDQRHGFHFFDAQNGVCLTRLGEIYRTDNAGKDWKEVYKKTQADIQTLYTLLFIDSLNGFAVGGNAGCNGTGCEPPGAILLKTADAGKSWNPVFEKEGSYNFLSLSKNETTGDLFILQNAFGPGQGQGGSILRSSNNGASWSSLPFKFGTSYYKIYFAQGKGYLIGGIGGAEILVSNDNGATWTDKRNFTGNWTGQVLANSDVIYTLVDNASIYKSIDGGNAFLKSFQSFSENTNHLRAANNEKITFRFGTAGQSGDNGIYISSKAGLGYTLDKGSSWQTIQTNKLGSFSGSSFYSQKEGYACTREKLFKIVIK